MQQRQIKSAAVPHLQELTGRTAIVTGSTSGIGLGIAQAFAASGMHVMLNVFGDEKETPNAHTLVAETPSPELSPRAFRDCVSEVRASCSAVVSISRADEDGVLTWHAVSPTRNLTVRGASRSRRPSEDREAQQRTHNNRSHDHSPIESSAVAHQIAAYARNY